MAECAARYGFIIEGVLAEGIEALISAEKLRGTEFCVGAIDATRWRHPRFLIENSVYRLKFQMVRNPCGAPMPCTAGSSNNRTPTIR